jgi:D-galactarolactone cycloisomerase
VKITKVEAQVWGARFSRAADPAWTGGIPWDGGEATVVKIHTDEGLVGIGAGAGDPRFILRQVAPRLEGQDPLAVERHTRMLRDNGGPWLGHTTPWEVEIALWDLVGKAAGLPLSKLWGGYTDRIIPYASTIELREPERRAEDALRLLERGFRAIKLRIHHWTLAEDVAIVEAVRKAVGDRMEIMVDANQAERPGTPRASEGVVWSYERALATCMALEPLSVRWLEEPLARYDLDHLARLARATSVPLAGGEGNVGLHEYRWLIDRDCYAIVQPDAVVSEGLGQMRKVAAYAELHGKQMVPHHGGNGVAIAAHLHLSAACPNSPYLELVGDPPAFGTEELQGLIAEPLLPDADGFVQVPQGPGLGVELGDRWAPVDG